MGPHGGQAADLPPNPGRNLAAATQRRRAVAVAGHQGDPATARAHLDDEDPGVRSTALRALLRLGDLTDADVEQAGADPMPQVRMAAAEAVAAGFAPGVLRDLMQDPDAMVLETSAWAAGELTPPPPGTVERLAQLAGGHDDALVREAAVAALGAVGDPAGLAAILTATQDKATVRRRAVLALAPFEGPEVDEALARALQDRDRQVRQAAEDLTS
jgi:HEAT repeat protein